MLLPEQDAVYDMNMTSFTEGELICIDLSLVSGLRNLDVDEDTIEEVREKFFRSSIVGHGIEEIKSTMESTGMIQAD